MPSELTQQSLKRVGHEEKQCLKENKGIHLVLVRSHCLSRFGGKQ